MENIVFTNDTINLAALLGLPSTTVLNGTLMVNYGTNAVTGTLTDSAGAMYGGFTLTNNGTNYVLTSTGNGTYGLNITYPSGTMAPATVTTNSSAGLATPAQTTGVAVTSTAACYAAGTLIRIERGGVTADVAVEDLVVGDSAVTASGAHRPIRWLGHRRTDCRNHPRPWEVMPVRIAAHALGPNRPARDLRVSPGHSICLDVLGEVLIPASALVNGTTITQEEVDSVTYWHVELDSHDIILAEALACESYLDMGNRPFFADADLVALEASPDVDASARTHADFCRPFHGNGPLVDAVRSQLYARALSLGWSLDASDPFAGLHLLVDGARVEPAKRGLVARFHVPAGGASDPRDVWLVSATSRPCEVAAVGDGRDLGVCIGGLTIDDGFAPPRAIDLADPLLCAGFHHVEDGTRRWTAGRTRLPATLWAQHEDAGEDFFLRVELAGPALPRWVAPPLAPSLMTEAPRLALVASA